MLTALITGATIVLVFPLLILYLTLVEGKILADMQGRVGPMRVGPQAPWGLRVALVTSSAATIAAGIFPEPLLRFASGVIR